MCRELRVDEQALPFAGELIAVAPGEADWEGAAERVLRGLALSVLVPEQHYAAVSDWIDDHRLKARVVYYRVPDPAREGYIPPPNWSPRALAAKLEIKDTPFAPWLERELARRADFACVETMAEFRREARAITKAGQFKGSRGRHEKDDTHRIDDRSHYVLGWSNERKLEALLWQAESPAAQLAAVSDEQAEYTTARDAAIDRGQVLAGLDQTREFADIDWQAVVNRTEELKTEKRGLEAASAELARLSRELETVRKRISATEGTHGEVQQRLGSVDNEITRARRILDEANATLAEPDCAVSAEPEDQYSEQKFLQVSRIIERFRGRDGQTETDRKWTRFVTDVRNWFIFTASERYREDDTEYEHYADSAGKSGG
jgi:uncharacterized protein YPO0396